MKDRHPVRPGKASRILKIQSALLSAQRAPALTIPECQRDQNNRSQGTKLCPLLQAYPQFENEIDRIR